MKKHKNLFSLILFVFLLCSVQVLQANAVITANKQSKNFEDKMETLPGKTLYIEDTRADIFIIGTDSNEVKVKAFIEVSALNKDFVEEYLSLTDMSLEPYRQGVRLKWTTPRKELNTRGKSGFSQFFRRLSRGRFNLSVHEEIQIWVPSSLSLEIENAYGDVFAEDVSGEINVKNRSGEIEFLRCGGDLNLRNSYAKVKIVDFNGSVDIRNSSGAVFFLKK